MARAARATKPKARERVEVRRLITFVDRGEDGTLKAADKRKRGTVVDDLIGWTDDGYTIHIPTGRNIGPGFNPDGSEREVKDDRKFVYWMLDQDPEGWESSRHYKLGEEMTPALKARLVKTRDSYPGD